MSLSLKSPALTAEVDRVTPEQWSGVLDLFEDASIYQTWSYGAIHWDQSKLSHIIVYSGSEIVGAAQVYLRQLPAGLGGIAYVTYGPLWRRRDRPADPAILARIVKAVRDEYVNRRRFLLRVQPHEFQSDELQSSLASDGLLWKPSPFRTLLLDLSPDLEALEMNLVRRWRKNLRKARRAGLEIVTSTDAADFDAALALYDEMRQRKSFAGFVDMHEFKRMQPTLPEHHKIELMLCRSDGNLLAALAWSAIGTIGIPLLAATSARGHDVNASYLLHWEMLIRLKERGCRTFDLGGINPECNPGVHFFKSGLAGKTGRDVYRIGSFDDRSKFFLSMVFDGAEAARGQFRNLRRLAAQASSIRGIETATD